MKTNRKMIAALTITATVALAALTISCGGESAAASKNDDAKPPLEASKNGIKLNGAGATFPAPLYAQWAETYKSATGVELNYAAIGSGGGIKQIQARTVDFGASDDPMKIDDLQKNGLMQFPATVGGVVLAYNLPGFSGEIKLDGVTLAEMFLGKEKMWNDSRIARMNPGVRLPHLAVTPVYRSDSSGTSFIFTTYLSQVSPAWKNSVGADKSVKWPAGVGGKGNAGLRDTSSRFQAPSGMSSTRTRSPTLFRRQA
jgi:phosphate transport system substrate-binding protein